MTIFKDFENPPMELLTLSAYVDGGYGWGYNVTFSSYYKAIKAYNSFLKLPLALGHFVPCIDEKPVSEPITIGGGIAEQAEADARVAYQKAEAAVLFEGWEIVWGDNDRSFFLLESKDAELYLGAPSGIHFVQFCYLDAPSGTRLRVPTYSDLALATVDNPLKFKQ